MTAGPARTLGEREQQISLDPANQCIYGRTALQRVNSVNPKKYSQKHQEVPECDNTQSCKCELRLELITFNNI